ncbi:MAG: DUF6250 domain-containing protein [Marinilabiliaceae bacterium]|nr:DUF6250 domain-containing protein [Marinilabiliaceae bacterium]
MNYIKVAILIAALAVCVINTYAQSDAPSGLNKKEFKRYWTVESESPDYKVTFDADTVEIVSPKGLTLWRNEKMSGKTTIEYDACVVVKNDADRLSDLNCFWMAKDPKNPSNIFARAKERSGIFVNCYALSLYYLGYGGNYNKTTRFRRYDGDERGITDAAHRPKILTEYLDEAHLLKANHWYHIKITSEPGRTCYYIDGERLVDYRDVDPHTDGWFGFRTTLSRTRITNFQYHCEPWQPSTVEVKSVGEAPKYATGVSFGVPFDMGYMSKNETVHINDGANDIAADSWPLDFWPDGSVKWLGVATVVPSNCSSITIKKKALPKAPSISVTMGDSTFCINTGNVSTYINQHFGSRCIIDSICNESVTAARRLQLNCSTADGRSFVSNIEKIDIERQGTQRVCVKATGRHIGDKGSILPFVVRLYFYAGTERINMTHTITYDGDADRDFIASLGVSMNVPLESEPYNRHVAFLTENGGVWSEPVQPLDGRRELRLPQAPKESKRADESLPAEKGKRRNLQAEQMEGKLIPPHEEFDSINNTYLKSWAKWDSYRLSQLTSDGYTIRKRANSNRPWIGTMGGNKAPGCAFIGDEKRGIYMSMNDFWQSYPSSISIDNATSNEARLTMWLWSPEAEPMDLRHYDDEAHGLEASYEDVQPGMSTPYGIARTTQLSILPSTSYTGKADFAAEATALTTPTIFMPTAQYLHDRHAFGIWSMPDTTTTARAQIELRLNEIVEYYKLQVEQHRWYGFWDYGDFMHAYDAERHEWRYDVGGFAWDNTELASPLWLWYEFLRTGRSDIYTMAAAMTRHTGEVDVYHIGPNAMLGSRHNVTHWGCGAKEARISQAAWNRIYHYLTTDERTGDLCSAVRDADQMLYHIDPMRLAQPRGKYPCTAPARLRIGPDWMAYVCNWMTEWERTQNTAYRDKILAGMHSITNLPHKIFTGPLALGYDPATGIITTECDTSLQSTNHLMTIMGGFEMMMELMPMLNDKAWNEAWLDFTHNYKRKALEIRKNKFPVTRLLGYAAAALNDNKLASEAWSEMLRMMPDRDKPQTIQHIVEPPLTPAPQNEINYMSTNSAATWSLDAIYMLEVCPIDN